MAPSSSYVKPKILKECIILVLQEAGPRGLTIRQMVERIKEKKWWDWKDAESGYNSVSATCRRHSDVFVRVAPGTFALWVLQDDDFTPYEKPMELNEAIIRVLQEAGPGGLTVKQMVQRIKKKKWWDWENDKQGYDSVLGTCREPSYRDIFVHVAPGTWALWALQNDDFTPYVKPVKPMTLKEAIILVLQEAGPGGLARKEIVKRIMEEKLWDWENEQSGYGSVSAACCRDPDVFVKHSRGVYALKCLQGGEGRGSSQGLAKEKARVVQTPSSGAKRAREAANESADESTQIAKKKKDVETYLGEIGKECAQEPHSNLVHADCASDMDMNSDSDSDDDFCLQPVSSLDPLNGLENPLAKVVPVEDRRKVSSVITGDERKEAVDACVECPAEQADHQSKEIEKSEEKSFSDLTFINVTDYTMAELKAIADAENKRIGILPHAV